MIEAYSSVYLGGSRGALVLFVVVLLILLVRPAACWAVRPERPEGMKPRRIRDLRVDIWGVVAIGVFLLIPC